jgi:hypothetical protein
LKFIAANNPKPAPGNLDGRISTPRCLMVWLSKLRVWIVRLQEGSKKKIDIHRMLCIWTQVQFSL